MCDIIQETKTWQTNGLENTLTMRKGPLKSGKQQQPACKKLTWSINLKTVISILRRTVY